MTNLCGPCAAGQCTGPGRGGICEHACHQDRPVAARIMDRLHGEALAEDEEREWERTGRIRCSDCGRTVRAGDLTSLPEHGCSRRQMAQRNV